MTQKEKLVKQIDTVAELKSIIEDSKKSWGFGWGEYRLELSHFHQNDYYLVSWQEGSAWASYILEMQGQTIKGAFTLTLQGGLEQEGAYRQAEREAVEQVFVPFLRKYYPKLQGTLRLIYDSYDI